MNRFDPMDFQPNSVGVMVVRVIRLKDIVRTLGCSEEKAQEVVKEIRGETSADGSLAFVLPSQLARWAYRRAGQPISPPPFSTVLVSDAAQPAEALKRAANREPGAPVSGSSSLRQLHADVRALKSGLAGSSAVTAREAAARLGCGRTRVFALLREGRLRTAQKAGRSTMVTVASIEAFLLGAQQAPAAPRGAADRHHDRRGGLRPSEAIRRLPL